MVILIIYSLFLIYFNMDILFGESLFLNINPSRKYINTSNSKNINLNYSVETKFNALCSLKCEYIIHDDSYNKTVDSGHMTFFPSNNKDVSFNFNLDSKGFGKKIYSFELRCETVKNLFCRVDKDIFTNSFILIKHEPSLPELESKILERKVLINNYNILNNSLRSLLSFKKYANNLFFPYSKKYNSLNLNMTSDFKLTSNLLKNEINLVLDPLYLSNRSIFFNLSSNVDHLNKTINQNLLDIKKDYSFLKNKFSFINETLDKIEFNHEDKLRKIKFVNETKYYNLKNRSNSLKSNLSSLNYTYKSNSSNISEFNNKLITIYNTTNKFYDDYHKQINFFNDFINSFDNNLLNVNSLSKNKYKVLKQYSNSFCDELFSNYKGEIIVENFNPEEKTNSMDQNIQDFIVSEIKFRENLTSLKNESRLNKSNLESVVQFHYNVSKGYLKFLIESNEDFEYLDRICNFKNRSYEVYRSLIEFNSSFHNSFLNNEDEINFSNNKSVVNEAIIDLFYSFSDNLDELNNYFSNNSNKISINHSSLDFLFLHNLNSSFNHIDDFNNSISNSFEEKLLSYKNSYEKIYENNRSIYNLKFYFFLKENLFDLFLNNNTFGYHDFKFPEKLDLFYLSIYNDTLVKRFFEDGLNSISIESFNFSVEREIIQHFNEKLNNSEDIKLNQILDSESLFLNSNYLKNITSFHNYCCYNGICKLCLLQDTLISDYVNKDFNHYSLLDNKSYYLNSNRTILVFLHGHSMIEGNPPEFSLKAFLDYQRRLKKDNVIDGGVITLLDKYSNDINIDFDFDLSFRTTYYYDYHSGEEFNFLIPQKSGSIESYSLRLKEIIESLILKTNSTKFDIVAHSMGGLVSRKY
ncbi:MAG: esterase/lipase family protein, partial [archaeon]